MLYFNDLSIGYRYGLEAPATPPYGLHEVLEEDIILFGERWDPRPQHVDPTAAREGPFRGLIASGAHGFALWTRLALAAAEASESIAVVAGLGSEFSLPAPIRPGDRISLHVEVTGLRPSKSRPDAGILTAEHEMTNQDGLVVFRNRATSLVARENPPSEPESPWP